MGEAESKGLSRWRKWGGVCCALLLSACVLVWWKGISFSVTGTLSNITPHEMTYEKEEDRDRNKNQDKPQNYVVYAVPAPPVYAGFRFFMLPSGWESNLDLFENGRLMSREVWKGSVVYPGAYLHVSDRIYFIPWENVDPESSPQAYTFQARYFLRSRYQVGLCLLLILSGVGLGLSGRPLLSGRADTNSGKPGGRFSRLCDSSLVVLPAASLGPFLSFLGRNAFYYSLSEMATSLAALAALSVVLTLSLVVLRSLLRRVSIGLSNRGLGHFVWLPELLQDAYIACAAGAVFALFSGLLAGDALLPWLPRPFFFLFSSSLSFAIAIAIVLRWGIRGLNTLLLSFLFVTSMSFLYNLLGETGRQQVAFPLAPDREIRFTAKPNIYFFFLESYTGREEMRDFYGIDVDPFYRELEKRGFLVRDTYSNRDFTVASAATLMAMRHLDLSSQGQGLGVGLLDAKSEVRNMITGRSYNPTFAILKRNGYRISYLQRDHYMYSRPSPAIDVTNLSFSDFRFKRWPLMDATGFFKASLNDVITNDEPIFFETTKAIIQQCQDRPTFHFIHTGLAHAADNFNAPTYHERWKSSYGKIREDFNLKLFDLLDLVESQDPQALIVLIGDHGAKMFGFRSGIDSPEYPAFVAAGRGDAETLARDKASVFFAIKSPVKSEIWSTRRISHVNLFRYLFSILSGDETLLEHPEPDVCISWDGKYIIARDGRPLKEWEPVGPEWFQTPRLENELKSLEEE